MITKGITDYTKDLAPQSFTCPFCQASIPNIDSTFRAKECYFNKDRIHQVDNRTANDNIFDIKMLYCPTCDNVSFVAEGRKNLQGHKIPLYPNCLAKQFPNYIPIAIRQDYEEAYAIVGLSPKASATLSRRCLQGMIRNFWNISKKNLYEEINALQGMVPDSQWKAIDAVRSIGNIAAHMEKDINTIIDVEPYEAEQLIKLIELLIEKWYIAKHDEEELFKSIVDISQEKKSKKH